MVQVLGDRWCPPDVEFKLEKGIWAAGNFMCELIFIRFVCLGKGTVLTVEVVVLVSLGFAMFGSGEL